MFPGGSLTSAEPKRGLHSPTIESSAQQLCVICLVAIKPLGPSTDIVPHGARSFRAGNWPQYPRRNHHAHLPIPDNSHTWSQSRLKEHPCVGCPSPVAWSSHVRPGSAVVVCAAETREGRLRVDGRCPTRSARASGCLLRCFCGKHIY
jgi:hypothetical protein